MRARLLSTFLIALTLTASAGAARADEAPPQSAAEAEARDRSRAAFRKGVAHLRAQEWGPARASFEAAWSLYQHPSILLNLGIARLRTDDVVRAEQDLVRFLSEDGGATPDELAGAREALAEARARLGTIRVVVSPASARVSVDGAVVQTVRRGEAGPGGVVAEVRTKAGRHAVSVDAEAYRSERRYVEVSPRADSELMILLTPLEVTKTPPEPQEERGPDARTVVGWSLVGVAGAALITGGVTALQAKSLADDYGDRSSPSFQDPGTRSEGITFRTAADVALGVGILSGAAAAILLLTDVGKGSPSAIARRAGSDLARGTVLRW